MANTERVSISLQGMTLMPPVGAFHPLVLDTSEGTMEARIYQAANAAKAILWLGDAYGGFDSPAGGMYDRLAERFQAFGISSLRLQYRQPSDQSQTGLDALVGAFVLQQMNFEEVIVVGHGQGAMGAVHTGLHFKFVKAVAVLAPRKFAGDGIEKLAPKPLLLLHGTEDQLSPTQVSRELLSRAKEPKRVYYYQRTGHDFTESADALTEDLSNWLKEQFGLESA